MSTEPKEADTRFSLSATLQNMELAEIPVSFNHTGVCIAFVVYIYSLAGMRLFGGGRVMNENFQRCKYNYEMLVLILDELMPWHTRVYDLSLLEVNR